MVRAGTGEAQRMERAQTEHLTQTEMIRKGFLEEVSCEWSSHVSFNIKKLHKSLLCNLMHFQKLEYEVICFRPVF